MTSDSDFIRGVLRDMEGNAVLLLSSGRTEPTEIAPHGKLRVDIAKWFVYPAELPEMVGFAEKARSEGRDAYLSPIIYGDAPYIDKKGNVIPLDRDRRPLYARSKDNALFSQTIYMDSDSCPPEAFRARPSRHVITSDGHAECETCGGQVPHYHDYWFLSEPVPAQAAAEVAHKITTAHRAQGTDPTGWSANKVLRLPTWNTTYDELSPFEVTWEDDDVDPITGEVDMPLVYDLATLQDIYSDIDLMVIPEVGRDVAPAPKLEHLPEFQALADRIPSTSRRLNDLLYKVPKGGADGWRSEQRYALLLDLKRSNLFTDEEIVALAWHSPAASKWREDKRGVDGLWWELQVRVLPVIAQERGDGIEPAPSAETRIDKRREAPNLLTPAQRGRVATRQDLVTLYLAYGRAKVNVFNAPYQTINAWTLMSLGLSEAAELPKEPRALGLNLYSITLGNSSTGKDESKSILWACIQQLFPHESPSIPAQSSREAFIGNLIERDDKVSWIDSNEADGLIAQIRQGGYSTGIVQLWTKAYDGEVEGLGRVGNKDLNVAGKHAIPVMHLQGTPSGMLDVLDRQMFYSGYLARQIWVIGEDHPPTRKTMESKFNRSQRAGKRAYDAMPAYFASQLATARMRLRANIPLDQKRAQLIPTDEAMEAHTDAAEAIYKHFSKEHDVELWKPVLRRFADILWKIAGISAAMNSRTVVGTFDLEVALFYAETWIANVMTIADQISDTYFSKQCDEIEKFIASKESRRAEVGAIYRFRKIEPKRVVDEYLNSLIYQGRIEERSSAEAGGPRYYAMKEAKKK